MVSQADASSSSNPWEPSQGAVAKGPELDGQDAVFAVMSEPATFGLDGPVVRIDAHGAVVFLAGPMPSR
jgi:hypothetical protein